MAHISIDTLVQEFDISLKDDYAEFDIWKRHISSPSKELRECQYKIKEWMEGFFNFPSCITGYRKWLSVHHNAIIHKWKKYIMIIDLVDFFWSIRKEDLYRLYSQENIKNVDKLLDFISFKGRLPQWAPTSPIVSNIFFKRIDYTIKKYLAQISSDITYSRFVDDIAIWFDCHEYRYNVFTWVQKILNQNGFKINKRKLKLYEHNKQRIVTWMIVNDDQVGIWYKKYRNARKLIYLYLKFSKGYYPSIKGLLLYIKGVDYFRYNQLKDYFFKSFKYSWGFQELFWIDENANLIIKSSKNKFNHSWWYIDKRNVNKSGNFLGSNWSNESGWYWK